MCYHVLIISIKDQYFFPVFHLKVSRNAFPNVQVDTDWWWWHMWSHTVHIIIYAHTYLRQPKQLKWFYRKRQINFSSSLLLSTSKNNIYIKHPARVSEETISGVKPLTNTYSNITRVCMMHIHTHHRGVHRLLEATRCQKPYVFEQSERKAEIQKASNR